MGLAGGGSPDRTRRSTGALLALAGGSWCLGAWWFLAGSASFEESTLRIVLGAWLVLVLPGLTWGELLGFESRHPLSTLALASATSSEGSKVVERPRPLHCGHAPSGLLNENRRGESSGYDTPQSGHANFRL